MRLLATQAGIGPAIHPQATPATNTERRGWLKRLGAVLSVGLLTGKVAAAPRDVRRVAGGDPFLGEIMLFAGNFAVQNYLPCDGRLLAINQYAALYSLLGNSYGGNGVQNFGLPDLRNRVPRGADITQGGTGNFNGVGGTGGLASVALTTAQLPAHTHPLGVSTATATTNNPSGNYPAVAAGLAPDSGENVTVRAYGTTANATANAGAVGITGTGATVPVLDPYQVITYQICVNGIFPSRI